MKLKGYKTLDDIVEGILKEHKGNDKQIVHGFNDC